MSEGYEGQHQNWSIYENKRSKGLLNSDHLKTLNLKLRVLKKVKVNVGKVGKL
jgi:hypothetical protein